ncbi:hypothetical protein [Brevundimonas sp. NIBR11]|uniref:hypothetical protein n=1 Tax=Brevundimonas sp. NIBR11 TaxID=3015999 RepID=UPI0022F0E3EA|nr:hypothetical protein [Brevundimonas sp. NIBR11]
MASKDVKTRSEKSRSEWRNDPRRDEKIFRYINTKLRAGQPVRVSASAVHSVWLSRKTLADADRAGVRIIPDVFLPHWDHSSPLMKMLGWGLASRNLEAIPFTLRVAPEVMKNAASDPVGVGRHMQDRLARHLRQRLPSSTPDFWFAVEQGGWDEPHIHGAIVVPEGARENVRAALAGCGGPWRSEARQVHFSPRRNLVKWVGYSTKWLYRSMVKIGGKENLVGATQGMRREAKRLYSEARTSRAVLYP